MRIISQDGTIDVNYDNVWLIINNKSTYKEKHNGIGWERIVDKDGNYIVEKPSFVISANTAEDYVTIGAYSTKKQALQVMKEIREAYKYVLPDDRSIENKVFQIPQDKGDKE